MPDEQFKNTFSKNIQYFMKQKNVTQMQLANDLELPYTTIASWVMGARMPRMNKVQMLADYFGIEISALMEEWQDPKKAFTEYATKWNSTTPEKKLTAYKNPTAKLEIERQNRIISTILALSEEAGADYIDYFVEKQVVDFNRCQQMFNLLKDELKLFIDFSKNQQ